MVRFVSIRRMKRALGVGALALLSGAAHARASGGRWHVPAKFIKVVEGCWQLWPDERITIRRRGSDGLESRSQFDPKPPDRAGFRRRWESAFYWPDIPGLEVGCGRPSQHGQVCLMRMVDGKLQVELWAFRYDHTKHAVRTAFVNRCATDPATAR